MTAPLYWNEHQKVEGKEEDQTHLDWKKTAEKERSMAGWKNWNAAKAAVQNRGCWIEHITALCAYWCHEKR